MPLNSLQDIFDTVARHLLTQKRKALASDDPSALCRYRNPAGLKCAAGALIADEDYQPNMEGYGVGGIINTYGAKTFGLHALPEALPLDSAADLLSSLQRLHDGWPVAEWPRSLRERARTLGLSCAVVDQLAPEPSNP